MTIDATGAVIDRMKAFGRDKEAKFARYGSMSPALFEKVQALKDQDTLDVSIWIEGFDNVPYDRKTQPSTKEHETAFQKWKADRKENIRKFRGPIENRLRAAGIGTFDVGDSTPAISASLKKGQLIALSHFPGVSVSEATKLVIQSADQRNMIKMGDANLDDPWEGPVDIGLSNSSFKMGDGPFVKLGEIEFGPIDFKGKFSDVFVGGTNRKDSVPGCNPVVPTDSISYAHATYVASVLAGKRTTSNPNIWGVAPNAYISMSHLCSSDPSGDLAFGAALNWAQYDGAQATNVSLGGNTDGKMSAGTRIYDTHVRDYGMVIAVAAGNLTAPDRTWVTAPAISYGVISVGNSFDNATNSVGYVGWEDDRMRGSSMWKNPVSGHSDRELPDVAAPGARINVWDVPGGTGARQELVTSGTSYSAPVVTGVAGFMAQESSIFSGWPEVTKAAIIATAWENIEGPANSLAASTDDWDGAGNVNAARAYRLARSVAGGPTSVGFPAGDIRTSTGYFPSGTAQSNTATQLQVTANAGDLVRFTVAWSVDSTYSLYDTEPSADLDLSITCPSGCTLPGSYKWDSTVEMVEFKAPAAGIYTATVKPYRVSSGTYYGVAADTIPAAAVRAPRNKTADPIVGITGDN